ncbi:MAG: Gfo/Idh/MocA family oxidoreductase, partial [Clostridia bacterium]|nr:Gfo/Idh/MocA family oxidoreductase [Clostridia bacterium]
MEKIKVGIIGCGGIGNSKHLPALSRNKNVEVVAFCDIIKERAENSAKKFGTADARVYEDYKEMLEKETDITAVHVCTPNRSHSFITIDALEAGKHVM